MTLVELIITMGILAIVALAVSQVSIGFQSQFAAESLKRQAADNARTALIWMERDLRTAGYGIEPALTFDFNIFQGTTAIGVTYCNAMGGNIANTNCKRDNGAAGIDEIVFYARNPNYWGQDLQNDPEGQAWIVTAAAANSLTLRTHGAESFPKNQILQIVCPSASGVTYVSVLNTVTATVGLPTNLTTQAPQLTDPFRQDPGALPCITSGGARAFLVERYRYYVEPNMLLGDNTVGSKVPTLVLDKGVDRNLDGVIDGKDTIKVAAGIIDLQVAYTRPTAPPNGSPNPTLGIPARVGASAPIAYCRQQNWPFLTAAPIGCAGLSILDFTTGQGAKQYAGPPGGYGFMDLPVNDLRRQSPFNATINEVQLSVVARSIPQWRSRQTPTGPVNVLPALLNRPAGNVPLPYELSVGDTTVPVRNMRTRALSYF